MTTNSSTRESRDRNDLSSQCTPKCSDYDVKHREARSLISVFGPRSRPRDVQGLHVPSVRFISVSLRFPSVYCIVRFDVPNPDRIYRRPVQLPTRRQSLTRRYQFRSFASLEVLSVHDSCRFYVCANSAMPNSTPLSHAPQCSILTAQRFTLNEFFTQLQAKQGSSAMGNMSKSQLRHYGGERKYRLVSVRVCTPRSLALALGRLTQKR